MSFCDETTFPDWKVKYLIFYILKIQNLANEKMSLLVDKEQNVQDLQVRTDFLLSYRAFLSVTAGLYK